MVKPLLLSPLVCLLIHSDPVNESIASCSSYSELALVTRVSTTGCFASFIYVVPLFLVPFLTFYYKMSLAPANKILINPSINLRKHTWISTALSKLNFRLKKSFYFEEKIQLLY